MVTEARRPSESEAGVARKRPVLRDLAYQKFIDHLFSGGLRPGELVSQRELCEALDVPLGPMREALKRLEAEHLITLIPHRGVRILDVDERFIQDAFAVRGLVEVEAVRAFVRHGYTDAVRDLHAKTKKAARLDLPSAPTGLAAIQAAADLDHEMHFLFLGALDNQILNGLFRRMLNQLRLSRLIFRLRRHSDDAAYNEHMQIMESVLAGDEDTAADAMSRHIEASRRRALGVA